MALIARIKPFIPESVDPKNNTKELFKRLPVTSELFYDNRPLAWTVIFCVI